MPAGCTTVAAAAVVVDCIFSPCICINGQLNLFVFSSVDDFLFRALTSGCSLLYVCVFACVSK